MDIIVNNKVCQKNNNIDINTKNNNMDIDPIDNNIDINTNQLKYYLLFEFT